MTTTTKQATSPAVGKSGFTLPLLYRLFFLLIEPLATLVGAYFALFDQETYLNLSHGSSAPTTIPLGTSIVMSQLGNMYFALALSEALVLRSTSDLRVWKAVIISLLVADVGHLYTVRVLGPQIFWSVSEWNAIDWGNIGYYLTALTMPYPEQFTGFQVNGPDTWLEFHKNEFQPKPFGDYDVDIKIECCGVCGSDVHTLNGGWGEQKYPLAVGHEIVGTAIRVGPKVTLIKEGQRVGVGAQSYSCLDCRQCKNDNETYCRKQLDTYGAVWPDTGIVSQGGYSSHVRTHEHWVFPIPDGLPSTIAAPMLCAGLTAYSPLARNGCGPGKKVGIVGLGGIGHMGLLFAKALGAEVWVISRSHAKEADARAMGADGFLATSDKGWNEPHVMTFDLIVNTANSFDGFDLDAYLSLLDVHAKWVSVGLPEDDGIKIRNQTFLSNGCFFGSSHLGSRRETLDMLQLAADKGIKTWVEEVPISEKNLADALTRLHKNDIKYRFCLTNYPEQFGA
ncbi:NADP-dependent alcohol dehydrogenase [Staphylotrichum tortipilum]|uniref:alcohol dehydrogenase (NADP(+)) n=1 Tax=Staphylotrichum tortipilum TaxID=2831512 RepID=A0AAN6RTU0_9PEZI|nr:NADP-dependent alcohol dehydrogenase [Staphylotrichum longicolle]